MHGRGGVAGVACMAGGVCMARVAYIVRGVHGWEGGQGASIVEGMHGRGRGHVWQGACLAGKKATAAGGTHPTGMHSCLFNFRVVHFAGKISRTGTLALRHVSGKSRKSTSKQVRLRFLLQNTI